MTYSIDRSKWRMLNHAGVCVSDDAPTYFSIDGAVDTSSEGANILPPPPPTHSPMLAMITPPEPLTAAPSWFPPEWLQYFPCRDAAHLPSTGQEVWPSLSQSNSRPSPSGVATHHRSHSEPAGTALGPKTRSMRSSSNSSSSSGSSSRPQKSILQRTSSTITARTVKSAKSVKFVDIPEVFYDHPSVSDDMDDMEPDIGDTRRNDKCQKKGVWRLALKRFVVDHPFVKVVSLRQREPPQPPRKLDISAPYLLYSVSCPSLSLARTDKETASLRSFKSARSTKGVKRGQANSQPDAGRFRRNLASLFTDFLMQHGVLTR